jgi:hypothetical protein
LRLMPTASIYEGSDGSRVTVSFEMAKKSC